MLTLIRLLTLPYVTLLLQRNIAQMTAVQILLRLLITSPLSNHNVCLLQVISMYLVLTWPVTE